MLKGFMSIFVSVVILTVLLIAGCESDTQSAVSTEVSSQTYQSKSESIDTGSYEVEVLNSDGSKHKVLILKEGDEYIGPNSERYDHLPTGEELQPTYGY